MGAVNDKEYRVMQKDSDRTFICCICDTFSLAIAHKRICDKHFSTTCYIQIVKKEDK